MPEQFRGERNRGENPLFKHDLPFFDTPFSRMLDITMTQQGTRCQDLELDYLRCYAMMGLRMADKHPMCQKYHDDYIECVWKDKTRKRKKRIATMMQKKGIAPLPPPPGHVIEENTPYW